MVKEPTIQDVLNQIQTSDKTTQHRFNEILHTTNSIMQNMQDMESRMDARFTDVLGIIQNLATHMDTQFSEVRSEISEIRGEMGDMKKAMVTKDYLDEGLADLRGENAREAYREIRKHEARYHGV